MKHYLCQIFERNTLITFLKFFLKKVKTLSVSKNPINYFPNIIFNLHSISIYNNLNEKYQKIYMKLINKKTLFFEEKRALFYKT